jgi:hypothetical protein
MRGKSETMIHAARQEAAREIENALNVLHAIQCDTVHGRPFDAKRHQAALDQIAPNVEVLKQWMAVVGESKIVGASSDLMALAGFGGRRP